MTPTAPLTMTALLQRANVSDKQYKGALQIAKSKTKIIMKRSPSEVFINNYNPVILTALRSNIDIQYITNIWACIAYLTSYIYKPERATYAVPGMRATWIILRTWMSPR